MKRLSIATLLCLLCVLSFANTYFLSTSSGNDANSAAQAQNQNTPWKTLDIILTHINDGVIVANDVVLLKRGDAFTWPRNYILPKAITIGAYGTGNIKPYTTAFETAPANRWIVIDAGKGIYETTDTIEHPQSNTLNLVTIDGISYAKGRTPNINDVNSGYLTFESHTNNSISDNQTQLDNSFVGAEVVIRTTHSNIDRGTILSTDCDGLVFNTANFTNGMPDNNGWGYFVQDNIQCLDQFGEWYYNKSTRKLDVCFGTGVPASFKVQYSNNDVILQPQASNVVIKDIAITGANQYGVYQDWANIKNITFKNVDFAYSGGDNVFLVGRSNITIDSCSSNWANSNAFVFSFHDAGVKISNTTIRNTAQFPGMLWPDNPNRYGFGIFYDQQQNVTDTGLVLKNSTIVNTGFIPVFVADNNNLVQNNYIDTNCTILDDGGCLYTHTYTPNGNTIKVLRNDFFVNNLLLHSMGAADGTPGNREVLAHGIYYDDNTNHFVSLNNTCAYNATSGIFMHNSFKNRVESNKFYGNLQEQVYMQDDKSGTSTVSDSIYLDTLRSNTLFSTDENQLLYYLALANNSTDSKNFNTWGIFDNNFLCSPYTDTIASYNHFNVKDDELTLTQWRNLFGFELNSITTPVNPIAAKDIFFVYNTSFTKQSSLEFPCYIYISAENVTYVNRAFIAPISSDILLLTDL